MTNKIMHCYEDPGKTGEWLSVNFSIFYTLGLTQCVLLYCEDRGETNSSLVPYQL